MVKAKKYTKLFEWQERIKSGGCVCEKCKSRKNLSVDHIVPVSILSDLYLDTEKDQHFLLYNDERNFQVLCKYCNVCKGGRIDIRNPKTIPLLKEILDKIS